MLTIAWDVDDVLNNLMRVWLEEWWKPRNKNCALNYEDLTENPPHRLLQILLEEYLESLDTFRLSGRYETMPPNQEVLEWFKKNGASFRHIALTAVPRIAAPISASWVFKHFGDWIRTFHFVPSPRPEHIPMSFDKTKGDYLKWLNRVDMLIDDHSGNIRDAKNLGIHCFMPSRPWNSAEQTVTGILEKLS